MKRKSIFTTRLIYSIFITIILMYLFYKTPNTKFILIPFLICSFSLIGKNLFLILNKQNYSKIFDKIFILSFLLFWFGILIYGCYQSFIDRNYITILFTIPFWIIGIVITKKYLFKINTKKLKYKFNPKIIISSLLVILCFILGIIMLIIGIKDTIKLNKETKNYITINGYFYDYDVYDDEDGTTYKLIYIYEVNDKEYYITTNYGTNYIPDKNSIREVKYNPDNPEESILVGTNNKNLLIFIGAFFTLGSFTFILGALSILEYLDKLKIDIMGIYIGAIFLIIGIGIIILQTGTTISLIETIKSFGLWIFIPILFIVIGLFQIIKCLSVNKNEK